MSRDTFEHLASDNFELVQYVARQSALSAFSRPIELVEPPALSSRFQQRMLTGDYHSTLPQLVAEGGRTTDLLLVDLIDERLGVYILPDGTVATRSIELIQSGGDKLFPHGTRHVPFGTDEHYLYWTGAIESVAGLVRQHMPHAAIVLLDIPWAERSDSGTPTPSSFGVEPEQANRNFPRYVQAAQHALNATVLALNPDQVASSPNHPWGEAPFHYTEKVYGHIAVRIQSLAENPTDVLRATASPPPPPTPELKTSRGSSRDTPPLRALHGGPNLLIAGAHRSGTGWLRTHLNKHPEIRFTSASNYFNRDARVESEADTQKYAAHFEAIAEYRWRGERTPNYFWHSSGGPFGPRKPDTAANIRRAGDPEMHVLLSLRDPVSRAVSSYWHNFANGKVPLGASILQAPRALGIVDLGFYKRHLEHWESELGAERLHVLLYDDLLADPLQFLQSALQAIGSGILDPSAWKTEDLASRENHRTWLHPIRANLSPISAQELAALVALYRDDVRYLENRLGRDLSGWLDLDELLEQNEDGFA